MNAVQPYAVHSSASVTVQPVILRRAEWVNFPGRGYTPQKGTWYGHVVRGRAAHDVTVVACIGCPSCGKTIVLSHSKDAARAIESMSGQRAVPISHAIDYLGRVAPDVKCMHGDCSFHRLVYLDRWNKTKPLYAIAYTRGADTKIEIAYSHAIDQREARMHLGIGPYNIIGAGPAIGFFVNEKTGRITAE